ncbi:cysteinyl-tRNA synthetase [Alkalibacterium subtropicum]|uniref:Cysteine--tRNA ligase n=1 Tax=Alkalibacterium subtropicum TaxID=753702 RepID=A0A1I1LGD6_9LACT|nr:cysteine--tRNA ligase [Alkalibacterium subtropicum]SFC71592.1 cysteinyl-tRNA synthetase [Alkalibacterium subtropicum]
MIHIYNTLTRKKETFVPLEEGKVKMYVCGPTVYNYIHIGNARSTVAFDTVRRYFTYRGYEVDYVSNFTDVDDKIIRAAKELGQTAPEVADTFIEAFYADTLALEVKKPTHAPRVMENIPDIITFVEALIDSGYAYEAEGDVYYRTRRFEKYGNLSRISLDDLELGASNRIGGETDKKEDPLDFALWKAAKEGEISWDSPWGKGRPGWHIECSVMATKYLGDTIDIHAGGQDLAFPHHENEIAQTEAKTHKTFANYWMHNGFVTMNEEKMSKSIGNVVLVKDLREKHDPKALRFFMSTAHYRRPINYSLDAIEEAKTNLNRIETSYFNASRRLEQSEAALDSDSEKLDQLEAFKAAFIRHMDDDFQTQNGITVVYDVVRFLNRYLEEAEVSRVVLEFAMQLIEEFMYVFGITIEATNDLLDDAIERLIEEREAARKERRFQRADEIRDLLKEKNIILEDTPQGVRWKRGE